MIVRETGPSENSRVRRLFSIAFELPQSMAPAKDGETNARHWAAFDADGTMMSALTVTGYRVRFDGSSCTMGGVGGVSTLPQYRRRGGIRACFSQCLPALFRDKVDFAYLYPFSTAFYRKFGFECCARRLQVTLDLQTLKTPRMDGTFRLAEPEHSFRKEIQALEQSWEQQFNMMVQHEDSHWDREDAPDPADSLHFTYVYWDQDETPRALVSFHTENQPDGRNLICSRLYFESREGFAGLLSLFASLASDHRYVKFQLPAHCGMEYLLSEWAGQAVCLTQENAGMVRVIRVQEVLRKAACRGSGSLKIQILDPQIPENNHCFRMVFQDGKAVSVEICREAPELRLTAAAFSALITGAGSLSWMEGVEILNPSPAISQVFYEKPVWITEFF